MEFDAREMQMYEKCPRCGSLSCTTELSTSDRKTKCSSCGFEGNITTFREHKGIEVPKNPSKPRDEFGKELLSPEKLSQRIKILDELNLYPEIAREDRKNFNKNTIDFGN